MTTAQGLPRSDAREIIASLRLLVIGAQKGGSTSVGRALAAHPSIFLPRDEVPLFEGSLWTPQSIEAAADRLRHGGDRLLAIKRPDLLADRDAPSRIADAVRDPIVVAVLRDPVDRAASAYWWYVQMGLLPHAPIDEGMGRLLDDRASGRTTGGRPAQVLDFGFYGASLARYRAALGHDRVVVLLPGDLVDGSWSDTITGALRIASCTLSLTPENRGTYDERRLRLLRTRARLLPDSQRPDYHAERRRPRYRVGRVVARGINEVDRRILSRMPPRPVQPMGDDVRRRMRDLYAEDGAQLAGDLGRPVPWVDDRPHGGAP